MNSLQPTVNKPNQSPIRPMGQVVRPSGNPIRPPIRPTQGNLAGFHPRPMGPASSARPLAQSSRPLTQSPRPLVQSSIKTVQSPTENMGQRPPSQYDSNQPSSTPQNPLQQNRPPQQQGVQQSVSQLPSHRGPNRYPKPIMNVQQPIMNPYQPAPATLQNSQTSRYSTESVQQQIRQPYSQNGQPPAPYTQQGQPPTQYPQQGQPPAPYQQNGQPPAPYPQQGQPPSPYQQNGQPPNSYPQNNFQNMLAPVQRPKINPDQIPSPVTVHEADQAHALAGPFLTMSKSVPPLAGIHFRAVDDGNCNPRFMRSTLYNIPITEDLLKISGLPFGLVLQPLADVSPEEVNIY